MAVEPLFEKPLDQLLAPSRKVVAQPTRQATASRDRSPAELLAIARAQTRCILVMLAWFLFTLITIPAVFSLANSDPDPLLFDTVVVVATAVYMVLAISAFVAFIMLTAKVYEAGGVAGMVLLWLFLSFLGVLLAWLFTHLRANRILKRNGLPTGFFGAGSAALREIDPNVRHENQLPVLGW